MIRRFSSSLLVLPLVVALAAPASASAEESDFVGRTNAARGSNGRSSYAVRSDLVSVARGQAQRMASQHRMYHNPNLSSQVSNWSEVGENVGVGGNVADIHNAFMGSPEHRSNILSSSFTEVGIGTARDSNGRLYVSEVFRRPYGAATSTPHTVVRPHKAPTRVVPRTVTTRRASRSAPRVAPAPRRVARKTVAVPFVSQRLRLALLRYRSERVTGSFGHAISYVHTLSLLGR